MSTDTPLLVSATVWCALVCYPAGLLGRVRPAWFRAARVAWTIGCAAFLIHALSAYALVYGLSHETALRETARQTAERTGFDSGAGLWLNWMFAALWLFDVVRWWARPERVRGQLRWGAVTLHVFFLFMIFNGAFVFLATPRRFLGLAITVGGTALLWYGIRRQPAEEPGPGS